MAMSAGEYLKQFRSSFGDEAIKALEDIAELGRTNQKMPFEENEALTSLAIGSLQYLSKEHLEAKREGKLSPFKNFSKEDARNIIHASQSSQDERIIRLLNEISQSILELSKPDKPLGCSGKEERVEESAAMFSKTEWATKKSFADIAEALKDFLGIRITRETLGYGSGGTVEKGRDEDGDEFAVKTFIRDMSKGWTSLEKGEINALLIKDHPNIAKTYALLLYDKESKEYMVINDESQIPKEERDSYQVQALISEVVKGEDLYDTLQPKEGCTPKVNIGVVFAQHVALQVSLAIKYLHKRDVSFRDLKPENVMFDPETSNVKLVDFGISKKVGPEERTNTSCGSSKYASPEVIQGHSYDNKIDSWGLGLLMIELATGFPPLELEVSPEFLESRNYNLSKEEMLRYNFNFSDRSDASKKGLLRGASNAFDSEFGEVLLDLIVQLTRRIPSKRISIEKAYETLHWLKPLPEVKPPAEKEEG